ncbi:ribonuclease III domain-containing protein [Entophlyctis helioformis]|nr:ribonuclease III domain-containing protein [Entophlyctis helioformis]
MILAGRRCAGVSVAAVSALRATRAAGIAAPARPHLFAVPRSLATTSAGVTAESGSSTGNEAQLAAFTARTGITFEDQSIYWDALTHKSFKTHRNENSAGRYHALGGRVLDLYVGEYVLAKFPDMPAEAAESIMRAYTAPKVLSNVGQNFGVQLLMRWKKPSEVGGEGEGEAAVRAWVTQSLVGALYQHKGPAAARSFIHTYFLSRAVDIEAHLDLFVKMRRPRQLLTFLMKRLGKPSPIARLIKETGRLSSNAVFIVGMYSGIEKIGEGYGSSLKMAETRAVKDALIKKYAKEVKEITLPSEFDDASEANVSFFQQESTSAH